MGIVCAFGVGCVCYGGGVFFDTMKGNLLRLY